MSANTYHVTIVGGGITGLATAFYLQKEVESKKLPITFTMLEATEHLGGKIRTDHRDGFVIESGPDSWLERKGHATQLAIDLGLEKDLVNNAVGQSYILKNDHLYPIPPGSVMGIPTQWESVRDSALVSEEAKKRAMDERFLIPTIREKDSSVGSFFRSRFGQEWVDQVMEPLLSGVYGNHIDHLSLRSTFPLYEKLLQEYGSLIVAMQQTRMKSGGTASSVGMFQTLKNGLESLVHRIEEVLPAGVIQKNASLNHIERKTDGYQLTLTDGRTIQTSSVIFTTSHQVTEKILEEHVKVPALNHTQPTSVATLAFAFPKGAVDLSLEGTGFVIPRKENYRITACTWVNKKWPHTTPKGKVLLRCFVGRPGEEWLVDHTDEEIMHMGLEDLRRIDSIQINQDPEFYHVQKLLHSRPSYEVGHQEWLRETRNRVSSHLPNVYLAGCFYEGIGLPDCIQQGKEMVSLVTSEIQSILV